VVKYRTLIRQTSGKCRNNSGFLGI